MDIGLDQEMKMERERDIAHILREQVRRDKALLNLRPEWSFPYSDAEWLNPSQDPLKLHSDEDTSRCRLKMKILELCQRFIMLFLVDPQVLEIKCIEFFKIMMLLCSSSS